MKTRTLFLTLLATGAVLSTPIVHAQTQCTGPQCLRDFVDTAENATALQQQVGDAVANICPTLGGPDGSQRDLFLRCNEMIATASVLLGVADPTGVRDLGLTEDELLAALQQVWGEELHSNGTLTSKVTNGQFSNIAGRLNALRVGAAGSSLGGQVASLDPTGLERHTLQTSALSVDSRDVLGGAAQGQGAGSRWGWFLESSLGTGDRDQTANEDGFDFDTYSVTLGVDYQLDSGVIGFSLGVDNFDADFDSAVLVTGGDAEVDGTSGSIFGAWFGEKFYVDGLINFGSLDSDLSRRVIYDSLDTCTPECPPQSRTVVGDTDGDYLSAGGTIGIDANRENWDLSASLSVAYRDIEIDGYVETDLDVPAGEGLGLALAYGDQDIESLRTILSVSATGNFSRDFGVLSPHFRAEWHHEFEDDPIALNANYAAEAVPPTGNCPSCVQFASDDIDEDFAVIGVGLSAVFANRVQVYGIVDTLLGLSHLDSTTFSFGLRGQF